MKSDNFIFLNYWVKMDEQIDGQTDVEIEICSNLDHSLNHNRTLVKSHSMYA